MNMSEIRTVFDLMRVLGNRLAGRSCVIRMQEPATTNSYGTMQVRPDGVPEIHISPGLGPQTIKTFLHELAHVRLHYKQIKPSHIHTAAPRTVTVRKEAKRPIWESQADALRDEWLAYGKRHADPTLPDEEGILWALLDYYKEQN